MRILSYNILDGGDERVEALMEVIALERPDILCLIEADSVDVVERIAGVLGMDLVIGQGQGHAAAILSKWAIGESINHGAIDGVPRSLVRATILEPAGEAWEVAAVHLRGRATEQRELEREVEIRRVLEIFGARRESGRAHILAGDFNANSPVQHLERELLPPRSREAWDAQGGRIPRGVIQQILEAGYVDTLEAVNGEAAGRMTSFTTEHPGQRVDYVFTFGIARDRLGGAWIVKSAKAKEASDHFPVGAEIEGR